MREILFKGKTLIADEWIEGYLLKDDDGDYVIFELDGLTYWISGNVTLQHARMVYPKSIGQFAGIYDKNGTRIFEGDILKHPTDGIGVVAWDTEMCTFVFDYNFNEDASYDCRWMYLYELSVNHSEVIGNIYDNPELLKEN